MPTFQLQLRAVGYQEGQRYIAHCLELDLIGQGDTPDQAVRQMIELADLQITEAIKEGDLRSIFFPAPPQFWELFARATTHAKPKNLPMPRQVDRFDYRAMALA